MSLPRTQAVPEDDVGTVLQRIARELATLTALSEDLQDTFGTMMSNDAVRVALHGDALQSLQSLDLLTQTMDALRGFTACLGDDHALRAPVDLTLALRSVALSALAARLAGTHSDASDMEFDLF